MSIKTIIARFLPLLDVTVVLLGLVIILITYAHFEEQSSQAHDHESDVPIPVLAPPSTRAPIRFVYLYAAPDGSCFQLDPNTKKPGKRIDTDSDKDIRSILQKRPTDATWLFLVFHSSDDHWGGWNQAKIDSLKSKWNLKQHQKLFDLHDVPF